MEGGQRVSETHRVYELLQSAIRRGRIRPSEALATPILMDQFGATRAAVRAALSMLAEDGVVERAPRRGTHATGRLSAIDLGTLRTYRNLALPVRELFVQQVTAPAVVRDRFELTPEQEEPGDVAVLMVERLLGNAGTLCLETSYIRATGEDDVRRFLYSGSGSGQAQVPLGDYVRAVFGEDLLDVSLSVQVTRARARVAELLEVAEDTPVFLIERVLFAATGVQEVSFAISEAQHSFLSFD